MAAATSTGGLFGGTSTGFTFGSGTPSTGLGGSTFGASSLGGTTAGTSGFSVIRPFGTSATTAANTPFAAFGKSTAPVAGTTTGISFGGLASSSGTSFAGLNTAKTTSTAPSLGLFGQTTQAGQTSLFNLGGTASAASTASGPSLGGLQTSSGFGGGLFTSNKAATTTTSLLGSTSTASTGLGLGTTSGFAAFSGFGQAKSTALTTGTTSASISGLGGTGAATTGAGGGGSGRQGDVKDTPLPAPLNEIAEHLKKYVKEQKEHRDEISRVSGSMLDKVREETINLRQTLALVSNSIQRDGCALENLKMDVSQELKNAEIAQRTNEVPPALQHENIAPQEYFQRLVESFEERMLMYRKQIEIMESHLASLSEGQALTPQDLSEVVHKVHETFIALAAQLHEIHEAVKVQKEHFLNYRRAYFKDGSDVFNTTKDLSKTSTEFSIGPSPFRAMPNSAATMATTLNVTAPQALGLSSFQSTNPSGLTGGLGISGMGLQGSSLGNPLGATTGLGTVNPSSGIGFGTQSAFGTNTLWTSGLGATGGFGNTSLTGGFGSSSLGASPAGTLNPSATGFGVGASAFTAQQPKFQLMRPPAGNKRGKRR